jgi:hypothetical protein
VDRAVLRDKGSSVGKKSPLAPLFQRGVTDLPCDPWCDSAVCFTSRRVQTKLMGNDQLKKGGIVSDCSHPLFGKERNGEICGRVGVAIMLRISRMLKKSVGVLRRRSGRTEEKRSQPLRLVSNTDETIPFTSRFPSLGESAWDPD